MQVFLNIFKIGFLFIIFQIKSPPDLLNPFSIKLGVTFSKFLNLPKEDDFSEISDPFSLNRSDFDDDEYIINFGYSCLFIKRISR